MTETDKRPLGHIVWHELMTADIPAARNFYAELLGWRIDDEDLIHAGDPHIARIQQARPGEPGRWIPYLEVPDPDAMAERAVAAGATLTVPPTDIPGVGRFAEIEDAEGAAIRLWKARPDPTVTAGSRPGLVEPAHRPRPGRIAGFLCRDYRLDARRPGEFGGRTLYGVHGRGIRHGRHLPLPDPPGQPRPIPLAALLLGRGLPRRHGQGD